MPRLQPSYVCLDKSQGNLIEQIEKTKHKVRMLQENTLPTAGGEREGNSIADETQAIIYEGNIPVGGIILWHGSSGNIPSGWALCNGSNGTPDLRNRFVVGAGDTYSPGDTGGSSSIDWEHNHSSGSYATDNDSHSHNVEGTSASESSHTHGTGSLVTANESSHTHGIGSIAAANESSHTHGAGSYAADASSSATVDLQSTLYDTNVRNLNHTHNVSGESSAGSAHTHSMSGTSAAGSTHNHTVSGSTAAGSSHSHGAGSYSTDSDSHSHDVTGSSSTEGSSSESILPPYYALCWIMRVS
jgi:hypothetical protein